jgi:uncharacterized protein DUF3568
MDLIQSERGKPMAWNHFNMSRKARPWNRALRRLVLTAILGTAVAACDPISLTVLGVGSATGVQHTLSGIAYKTFTSPLPKVRSAALAALGRMEIKVGSKEKTANGEVIKARASDRDIEIELEALSSNTTRMRTTARSGIFSDAATATEIIIQTEKALGGG